MPLNELKKLGIQITDHTTGEHRSLCPRCSHTRKKKQDRCLAVKIDEDGLAAYVCHNCGWTGNISGKREKTTVRKFTPITQITPEENPNKPESMYQWFQKRGISKETVDKVGCYVTERNVERCIVFPYLKDGVLVNRKYRTLDKKFYQDKGAERSLFNIDSLDGDTAIFVEGEMDSISLIEAGYPNVVSLPDGAPAKVSDEMDENDKRFAALVTCEKKLEGIKRFILATDADGPGKALAEELARRLGRENCWLVTWPVVGDVQRKDANEVLAEDGPKVLMECIEAARPYPVSGLHEVEAFEGNVYEIFNGKREPGLSTGWASLDNHIRVRGGDLTVVTGYPGAGKSEFIDALAVNLARKHGWKFALCSFENMPDEHIGKLCEKYCHAPFWDGPTQKMDAETLAASLKWVGERFFFIRADDESPTVDWILERATVAARRYGIKGLVIDPYNEVEHRIPQGLTETSYISMILGKIRRWAKNHGVHVWFIAHPQKLYRSKETGSTPVPSLMDVSGSHAWSAKADFGIVVHRHNFEDRLTEVKVVKVRHKWLGKIGSVMLEYAPATGEYRESDEKPPSG